MSYLTGTDATRVVDYARETLVSYLNDTLNAEPYATRLGKGVTVTPYMAVADAAYAAQEGDPPNGTPFILVLAGVDKMDGEWTDGANRYRHHAVMLLIDCSMSDTASETGEAATPGQAQQSDRLLVAALDAAIRQGYGALSALFLSEAELSSEGEMPDQPNRRNPHTLSVLVPAQVTL